MGEEWGINIQSYAVKIKKAVQAGIEKEFIIQTKGKGLNGRFTVPGLKARKKKRKNALTKKYDEDEDFEISTSRNIQIPDTSPCDTFIQYI